MFPLGFSAGSASPARELVARLEPNPTQFTTFFIHGRVKCSWRMNEGAVLSRGRFDTVHLGHWNHGVHDFRGLTTDLVMEADHAPTEYLCEALLS